MRASVTLGRSAAKYRLAMVVLGAFILAPFFGAPIPLPLFLFASGALFVLGVVRAELTRTVILGLLLFFPQTIDNGTGVFTFTILLAACTFAATVLWFREGRQIGLTRQGLFWALGLVGALIAVTVFSRTPLDDQVSTIRIVILSAVLAFMFGNAGLGKKLEMRSALSDVSWLGGVVALIVILQVGLQAWPFLDQAAWSENYTSAIFHGRPGGTLGHPIFMSFSAAAMALAAMMNKGKWWQLAFSLNAVAVILSGSRSAWIALALAILVYLVILLSTRFSRSLVILVTSGLTAVMAILVVALATSRPLQDFLSSNPILSRLDVFNDASGNYRVDRMESAWSLISADPLSLFLGRGLGASASFLSQTGINDSQPDSFDMTYLSLWLDVGVVGLFLIFTPFIWLIFRASGVARYVALLFVVECAFVTALNWVAVLALPAVAFAAYLSENSVATSSRKARRIAQFNLLRQREAL